jgi:hypothetical protein
MNLARGMLVLLAAGATAAARSGDEPPLRAVIDREIEGHLERLKIAPAPLCDDATFLRRVTLDLVGTIPAVDDVEKFLADKDPAKRSKAIERLLDDPRYAGHQATQWDLALFTRNPASTDARKREAFQRWLTEQFAKNVAYDKWVLDLFIAEATRPAGAPPTWPSSGASRSGPPRA